MGYALSWREISATVTKHEVFPSSDLTATFGRATGLLEEGTSS